MPFQERLYRVGVELGNRLHEQGINWWDVQLEEYGGLPKVHGFPRHLGKGDVKQAGADALEITRSGSSPRAACSMPGAATSASS
jgi:hypothetical protein